MVNRDSLIYCLIPNLEVGGAETQLLRILPHFRDKFEVRLLAQKKGLLVDDALNTGLYQSHFAKTKIGFAVSLLTRIIISRIYKRRIVIIEAYLPSMIFISALVKLILRGKVRVIANRRSQLFYRGRSMFRDTLDVWSSKHVDFTICNSPSIARELVDKEEVKQSKLSVIPNAFFRYSAAPGGSRKKGEARIIVVSNHHRYKRVNDILRALAILKSKGQNPEVLLFGKGEDTSSLENTTKLLGLTNVHFRGVVKNPWFEFCSNDIFVHASETEGFSNAVLEAMGNSLACVLSNIESNRFVAGDCALYFEVGDYEELSKKLLELLNSPQERLRLGLCSLERVEKEFSVEKLVQKRVEIYNTIISSVG